MTLTLKKDEMSIKLSGASCDPNEKEIILATLDRFSTHVLSANIGDA